MWTFIKIFMGAYDRCHRKLQFWLKFLILLNVFWTILCFLEQNVFWTTLLNPLLTLTWNFFEWWSSLAWNLTVLLVLMNFLTNLILSYSDEYLFVYVGIFLGAAYFLSEIFLEIVHLLVGILLNPLLPKKTYAPESVFFFFFFFSLLIRVFVDISVLGTRSFTVGSPEKLKCINPNVEMTLQLLVIVQKNYKCNMSAS